MIERKMFRDGIFKYFQHVHSPAHYTIQQTFQLKHSNNSTIMARTGFPLRCGVTGYLLKHGSSQRGWMIFCDIAVFCLWNPTGFMMKQWNKIQWTWNADIEALAFCRWTQLQESRCFLATPPSRTAEHRLAAQSVPEAGAFVGRGRNGSSTEGT